MAERVVFYQLTQKYVNKEQDIPEESRQVIYYSLAIGHHMGVLDCFQSMMEIPLEEYRHWVAQMPAGTARHKLEGLLRWGEIEIKIRQLQKTVYFTWRIDICIRGRRLPPFAVVHTLEGYKF